MKLLKITYDDQFGEKRTIIAADDKFRTLVRQRLDLETDDLKELIEAVGFHMKSRSCRFGVTELVQCELCGGVLTCDGCGGPDYAPHQPWCEEFNFDEEDG